MAVVKRTWASGGTSYYAAYMAEGKQYREKVGWRLPSDATKTDHKDMRTEAQALALERKRQRLNGTLVLPHQKAEKPKPLTFTEMAEKWQDAQSGGKGRPFHAQRVKQWTGSHGDHFKDKLADDVTPADLDRFVALRRSKDNAGASTIRKELVGIASLYRWGRDRGHTTGNPAAARIVKRPQEPPATTCYLTEEEEKNLLAALDAPVARLVRFCT